jgi:hypothetical protein
LESLAVLPAELRNNLFELACVKGIAVDSAKILSQRRRNVLAPAGPPTEGNSMVLHISVGLILKSDVAQI